MESRGRTFAQVEEQYHRTVRPMHYRFVEPSRKWADVLIPEGGNNRVALDLVACKLLAVIRSKLGDAASKEASAGPSSPPETPEVPALRTIPPPVIAT